MAKSLAEYAAEHPQREPEREREAARVYRDLQEERETIAQIKTSITQQLEQGAAPQYILYSALRAIGILTHDNEWAEAGQQALDKVYSDLAQQSFLTDNAAIAAQRLEEMQAGYNDKMRQQLTRQLKGYRKIERALQEALQAVGEMQNFPELGEETPK